MTTTIAWKSLPVSPALSVTGLTIVGFFNQLNNYFTSLAANADCHWEVCSFSVAANPYHLVLKRKSGLPGRILFMGTTTVPASIYNDAMRNFPWSGAGTRAAYFPDATSDVPANLLTTAGDVFTDPTNCTGMCATFAVYSGPDLLKVYSSVEGIVLRLGPPAGTPTAMWILGDLMERYDEVGIPCAGYSSSMTSPMVLAPASTSQGFAARLGGTLVLLGESMASTLGVQSLLRDLATKRSWYYPIIMGTAMGAREDIVGYKLRQIARGGAPLAGSETLYVSGPVEKAYAVGDNTTLYIWITNDKV